MSGRIGRAARGLLWLSVWASSYGAFVLAYAIWGHAALDQHRQRAERESYRLEVEARNLEVVVAKHDEFVREAKQRESRLEWLDRILPPEPLPGVALLQLGELAREAGLERVQAEVSAAGAQRSEFHGSFAVAARVQGGLPAIVSYVGRLARQGRLVDVRGVTLERQGPAYLARFDLSVFYRVRTGSQVPAEARGCERGPAARFAASDAVVVAIPLGQERTEVPGAVETLSRYRVSESFSGSLERGDLAVVRRTCVDPATPAEPDGFPPLPEHCSADEGGGGAVGRTARLLFLRQSSPVAGTPLVETPDRGAAKLTCLPLGSQPEGFGRVAAWMAAHEPRP